MGVALSELPPPPGGWTTDDLDQLPEDGHRYELIDGTLEVTQGVEIRISRQRSLTPDVLVVTAEAEARMPSKYQPHEVVLAVEVVSPGSVTMDRVTKPARYAKAGVPYYWRVETQHGIVVHTHKLEPDAEVYVPTDQFEEMIKIDEPREIEVAIDAITPRFYRPGR